MSSDLPPEEQQRRSTGFAPNDYTDGKTRGQWKSEYPFCARVQIWIETFYLLALLIGCLYGIFRIFIIFYDSPSATLPPSETEKTTGQFCPQLLAFLSALFAGTLGGCTFGLKCMYHFVAKLEWHQDRRLWRILTPIVSGVLSLIMVFLVTSGLIQIFDPHFIENPIRIVAFSFLTGYFSDKALAKMVDVADTLFGGANKDGDKNSKKNKNETETPQK